ncbi:hypothetical protein C1646_684832 [Rhizophagus diaphanus]|nr:hypothetical protein C1646_684832 [Rhizophagus diaphanus] [Rhizophagus sp. MUCL 43196]
MNVTVPNLLVDINFDNQYDYYCRIIKDNIIHYALKNKIMNELNSKYGNKSNCTTKHVRK